jgi:hypothetical protein
MSDRTSSPDATLRAAPVVAASWFQPWKPPLCRAALTWWGGSWAAFVLSPLAECSHCVRTYLALLPIQPGVMLAHLTGASGIAFVIVAVAITLAFLVGTTVLLRESGARWLFVAVPLALLAAAHGIALGHALRM